MPVRTTDVLVGGIVELDADIPVAPFIESANILVNRVCLGAKKADGTPYYDELIAQDAVELEMIERWLSAHFYCIRDPRAQFEGVSSIMTRFQTKVDLNLSVTHYGQQAMALDTSGALSDFNKDLTKGGPKRKVGVWWLGVEAE